MIKRILAGIAAAGIAVTVFTVPAHASTHVQPANWTGRTCSAFARWQARPTTAGLDKLVTFSLHRLTCKQDTALLLLLVDWGCAPSPVAVEELLA